MFDNPPVVDVFECAAGDLLLVTAGMAAVILQWVDYVIRVQPARRAVCSAQCELRTIGHY